MTKPPQPPEGALIARAAKAAGHSQRQAAARADLSEGRYRQIVNGYIPQGDGNYREVHAPANTIARIAFTLDIAPDELREVGREDAAEALELGMRGSGELAASMPEEHIEDDGAWMKVGQYRDDHGVYTGGAMSDPRRDGSQGTIEVKYRPGANHYISTMDMADVIGSALQAARRHTKFRIEREMGDSDAGDPDQKMSAATDGSNRARGRGSGSVAEPSGEGARTATLEETETSAERQHHPIGSPEEKSGERPA